jgi:hypothetical protein
MRSWWRQSNAPLVELFFLALVIRLSGSTRQANTAHKFLKARVRALLSLPLTTRGQETNSTIARRTILNGPSFQTEDPAEISRGTSPSVSARADYSGTRS